MKPPRRDRWDDQLRAKWYDVCARRQSNGIESLSDAERVWIGVRAVIDATGDGGIYSYFYNAWADDLQNSLTALDAVGVAAAKTQLGRVAELFPGDSLQSLKTRNEAINSWGENGPEHQVAQDADRKIMLLRSELEENLLRFLKDAGIAN